MTKIQDKTARDCIPEIRLHDVDVDVDVEQIIIIIIIITNDKFILP